MIGISSARRVVLAVEEAGIPESLVDFATSLCGVKHLPLLAQLRLEPGLDTAADLSFVSLVDRSGSARREWTPREALQSRARLLNRWQERLRALAAGGQLTAEVEARKCSRSEQLETLIAGGDFVVMSSSRAAPAFEPAPERVIVLDFHATDGVMQLAREVCRKLRIPLESWSAATLGELSTRLGAAGAGSGITLVLARAALESSAVQVLSTFLRGRGRGLVIVP